MFHMAAVIYTYLDRLSGVRVPDVHPGPSAAPAE